MHALDLREVVEAEDRQVRSAGFARQRNACLVACAGPFEIARLTGLHAEIVEGKRLCHPVANIPYQASAARGTKSPGRSQPAAKLSSRRRPGVAA